MLASLQSQNCQSCAAARERLLKLNVGTLVLAIIGAIVFGYFAGRYPLTLPRVIGIAIVAVSFPLFVLARIQLGRAFSIQARASELVTTGLYSRIRNPIYVFGSLVIAGAIIWYGNFWLFLVFLVIIPMQVIRARREARVLEGEFGDEYREYRRKTWI
jgi:protein-S-isoprenylcysteine O-methyltransferase Ste14